MALYITGENDTLKGLKEKEGFEGSLADYQKLFTEKNPTLFKKLPKNFSSLPPYMPVYLATMPTFGAAYSAEVAEIVSGYSPSERQILRTMQEESHDIPTHVATVGVLEEFQSFLIGTKKTLNAPVIATDFDLFNRATPRKALIKFSGEGLKHASGLMAESSSVLGKEKLFKLMKERNDLNHKWLQLKAQKGASVQARLNLEKQIKDLTGEIKKLLPKKITGSKYLHGLPSNEARKIRSNSASLKLARKGAAKIKATHLDHLSKSGLAKQRAMIKGFKIAGNTVKKGATYLTYGLAGISIAETYANGGDVARTTFQEVSGIAASTMLGTAVSGGIAGLGSIALGMAAGDMALGATLLVCYPVVGWVILAVAGVAVASLASSRAKEIAGTVYDGYQSGYIDQKASEFFKWICEQYKSFSQQIYHETAAQK